MERTARDGEGRVETGGGDESEMRGSERWVWGWRRVVKTKVR